MKTPDVDKCVLPLFSLYGVYNGQNYVKAAVLTGARRGRSGCQLAAGRRGRANEQTLSDGRAFSAAALTGHCGDLLHKQTRGREGSVTLLDIHFFLPKI